MVNPALPRTGGGFGERLVTHAEEMGWAAQFMETATTGNVDAIRARLAREEFQLVVAAGGDGTVAEVMAAAYRQAPPVGIVPMGTANIVARELGLPTGRRVALRFALERYPRHRAVDLARVNDRYSVLAAGMGFDVMIMRHTPPRLKSWLGRFAYFLTGAYWLPGAPAFHCTIRADGVISSLEAVIVLVANAGMLGASPFRFGPGIAIDDGWLDLCVYRPRTLAGRGGVLWAIATSRQARRGDILLQKVRSVEITSPDVSWHQIDGEVHRGNALRVEILPKGINIVA